MMKQLKFSNIKQVISTKKLSQEERLKLFKIIGHCIVKQVSSFIETDKYPFTMKKVIYYIDNEISLLDKVFIETLNKTFNNSEVVFIEL